MDVINPNIFKAMFRWPSPAGDVFWVCVWEQLPGGGAEYLYDLFPRLAERDHGPTPKASGYQTTDQWRAVVAFHALPYPEREPPGQADRPYRYEPVGKEQHEQRRRPQFRV